MVDGHDGLPVLGQLGPLLDGLEQAGQPADFVHGQEEDQQGDGHQDVGLQGVGDLDAPGAARDRVEDDDEAGEDDDRVEGNIEDDAHEQG